MMNYIDELLAGLTIGPNKIVEVEKQQQIQKNIQKDGDENGSKTD